MRISDWSSDVCSSDLTGTLAQELLQMPGADIDALRAALAQRGLAMTDPLGFDNSYALGMDEARAQALDIDSVDDLRAHPDLRLGFSNEFMQRADGRSEEHTSELQSLMRISYAVFCLKKTKTRTNTRKLSIQ